MAQAQKPKSSKRMLLIGGGLAIVLLVVGLMTGEIGAKLIASFSGGERSGLLETPEVSLPPEPLVPYSAFTDFEEWKHDGHTQTGRTTPLAPMQFVVSNTILSSWLTTIVLIAIFVLGMRRAKLVPRGLQNVVEAIVEVLLNFCESVVGKEKGRVVLPIIATIFLFVAFNAWMGLLPIYPSLGPMEDGKLIGHLLRPAGTDLNMPLAVALVAFVFIEMQGLRALGLSYIGKFVRVSSLKQGVSALFRGKLMDALQGFIDFGFVGPLEAFSEFIRIISFTFRLFGNMTAGEILVLMVTFLVSFVATVIVYGLEMFVGFVQALVFSGLTLVFAALALAPHEHEHEEHAEAHAPGSHPKAEGERAHA